MGWSTHQKGAASRTPSRADAGDRGCLSPLWQMTQTTPTCLWNDSATPDELAYAMEHGAVGATCNPVIALSILKKEMPTWHGRIETVLQDEPSSPKTRSRGSSSRSFRSRPPGTSSPSRGPAWTQRSDLDPDRPEAIPQRQFDHRPGGGFQQAGAKRNRQDPRHPRRRPSHRRGDLSRRQRQRHGLFHAPPMPSCRRGRRGDCSVVRRRTSPFRKWDRYARSWSAGSMTG